MKAAMLIAALVLTSCTTGGQMPGRLERGSEGPKATVSNAAPEGDELDGTIERILELLAGIPEYWENAPAQQIPMPAESIEEVLSRMSDEEEARARAYISGLVSAPLQERSLMIASALETPSLSENELWFFLKIIEESRATSRTHEALAAAETWMRMLELNGSRDVLMLAAACSLDLLLSHVDYRQLLEIAEALETLEISEKGAYGKGRLLFITGRLEFWSGANEKALETYDAAREVFAAIGNELGIADTYRAQGHVLRFLGKNEEALGSYEIARGYYEKLGNRLQQAFILISKAEVHYFSGNSEAAGAAARQAEEWFKSVGNLVGVSRSLLLEAQLAFTEGRHDDALEAMREAQRYASEASDLTAQANAVQSQGRLLYVMGKNWEALEAFWQARDLFRQTGDSLGEANSLVAEAEVRQSLWDLHEARRILKQARKIFRSIGESLGLGNSYMLEGRIFAFEDKAQEAIDAFQKAREQFMVAGSPLSVGASCGLEASVRLETETGDDETTLRLFQQGEDELRRVGDPLDLGAVLLGEAQVLVRMGKLDEAAELARAASQSSHEAEDTSNELLAVLEEARIARDRGDVDGARKLAYQAVDLHEARRRVGTIPSHRMDIDQKVGPIYDVLVPLLAHDDERQTEALLASEAARSRVLLDLIGGAPFEAGLDRAEELRQARRQLGRQLAEIDGRLATIGLSDDARQRLRLRRLALERTIEWRLFEISSSLGSPLVSSETPTWKDLRNLVDGVGQCLSFYVAEDEVIAFLLLPGRDRPIVHIIEGTREQIESDVRELLYSLANSISAGEVPDRARTMWNKLISPFTGLLREGEPLLIVPHGSLHQLPFEALVDPEGTFLGQRWPVTVAPSLASLRSLRVRHREADPTDSFLGLASHLGLPGADEEIRAVARYFDQDAAILGTGGVTFDLYRQQAPRAHHLLISAHGTQEERGFWGTYLEIRPDPAHDDRLTGAEIVSIPISAELVTLAACESAKGEALLSDDRLDLARAFLIAGSASVLATRWKVPDSPQTSDLIVDFYREYRGGSDAGGPIRKDEALRRARMHAIDRGDPPSLWAAWVLVGDPR